MSQNIYLDRPLPEPAPFSCEDPFNLSAEELRQLDGNPRAWAAWQKQYEEAIECWRRENALKPKAPIGIKLYGAWLGLLEGFSAFLAGASFSTAFAMGMLMLVGPTKESGEALGWAIVAAIVGWIGILLDEWVQEEGRSLARSRAELYRVS
jgi:hypothetical protein